MYPIFRPPPDFFVQKKKEKFPWFKLPVKVQQKITGKLDDVSRKTFFLSSYQTIQSMPNNCIKGITLSRESCMKITWIDRKQPVTTWYDQGGETTMLDTFQLLLEKNASTLRAVNFFDASFFIEETTIKHLKNLSMAIVNFRKHDMLDCGYTSLEQLYQISDTVTVNRITLDLDQLLKFETAYLTFQKVIFSSNDINQYLKLFMKGKINKRTRSLTLHMEKYSLLDADQIIKGLELLGGQQESPPPNSIFDLFSAKLQERPCKSDSDVAPHPPPPPSSSSQHHPVVVSPSGSLPMEGALGNSASIATRPRRQSLLIGQRSLDVYNEVDQGPKFVRWIIEKFRAWGFIIAKHAWIAIIICLIVSTLSTLKIVTTKQKNDITGYSPYGARALTEYNDYNRFFSSDGLAVAAYLFIVAKDNGSMTRPDHLEETIQVLNYAMNNITMYDSVSKKNETFNQFCQNFCQINEPVRQFYNGYKILTDGGDNLRIKMNYPISEMFGRQFSLQPNFFGVETFDRKEDDEAENILSMSEIAEDPVTSNATHLIDPISKITNVKSVKMIALQFRAEHKPGWTDDLIKKWEMELVEIFEKKYNSKRLKIYSYSQSYVEEEMVRGGIIMIPYLVVGFSIMCVCSCILVMTRALYMHQENFYKIILAIMACLTPLLACSTALAVMFLCGVRFASILCVIPFLVLSIGVDSSYLMIHEWQRVTKHMRETPRKKDSVGHRMSEVMAEIGPAILISCLTNMFADFVGAFTSSPEITLLCAGNMLSMWFAFIYQMTFYAGLMSIVGKFEFGTDEVDKNRMEINIAENRVNIARHHRPLTRQPSKFHEATQPIISESLQKYTHLMTTPLVFVGICVLYLAYLAFSIYGITQVNINLTAQKLFALDSPLLELDELRVKYQVPHFSMATVFINNPGNLEDPQRLMRLNRFIREMEGLNGTWGKSWGETGTKYFVRDYDVFQQSFGSEDDEEEDDFDSEKEVTVHPDDKMTYREDELKYFLNWPEYDFWQGFVKTKNATNNTDPEAQVLDKFFFTTGYHGQNLSVWTQRGLMLKRWRSVVDEYKDFGASVFHEDGVYLDLIDNMPFDTMQSVLGTLVCMAFVCFVFLNNLFTVAIASLSVLSICAGILGILSWWGVDLDPITMAAMIISIGFSVDIPAHVSYHYYQASIQEGPMSPPSSRLANCLSSVAFPALQAAVSTILCVCSLLFVNLYMAEVFVKTMILCVVLCNLHGLVFLPAILILLDSIRWACRPKGAAAQRPKPAVKTNSRQKTKNSKIQPEKSSVTDRPEV